MQKLLVIIPSVLALAMLGLWVRSYLRGKRWPRVEGSVEKCERTVFNDRTDPGVPGVRLHYSFSVNGEIYPDQVAEIGFSVESNIEEFLDKFQPGRMLVVRYDPNNPGSSMVDPGDNADIAELAGMAYTTYEDGAPPFPFDS